MRSVNLWENNVPTETQIGIVFLFQIQVTMTKTITLETVVRKVVENDDKTKRWGSAHSEEERMLRLRVGGMAVLQYILMYENRRGTGRGEYK